MNAKIRLMVRVASRRIEAGETVDNVLKYWTALTDEEKNAIREAIEKQII